MDKYRIVKNKMTGKWRVDKYEPPYRILGIPIRGCWDTYLRELDDDWEEAIFDTRKQAEIYIDCETNGYWEKA